MHFSSMSAWLSARAIASAGWTAPGSSWPAHTTSNVKGVESSPGKRPCRRRWEVAEMSCTRTGQLFDSSRKRLRRQRKLWERGPATVVSLVVVGRLSCLRRRTYLIAMSNCLSKQRRVPLNEDFYAVVGWSHHMRSPPEHCSSLEQQQKKA